MNAGFDTSLRSYSTGVHPKIKQPWIFGLTIEVKTVKIVCATFLGKRDEIRIILNMKSEGISKSCLKEQAEEGSTLNCTEVNELAQEAEHGIREIELPFSEAIRISFQSLRIRFWRSMITTAGILLGIAFFVAVLSGAEISNVMQKSEEFRTVIDDTQTEGISAQQVWLIVMSLIVCVVGIANSMLMAVTERFREIGTMKCLGALNRFVVELFLLESGFQGLAGAIMGSLVGFISIMLLSLKDYGLDLFISFPEYIFQILIRMAIACALGMVLAVIGALGPAYRAAKLPPAEAMRVEV